MQNLANLDSPSYLLAYPGSFHASVPNNAWMQEMSMEDRQIDFDVALAQWMDLYGTLAANSLVTVLPTPHGCTLQDLVFVSNLGVVIDPDTIIISNFTSPPRFGETKVGEDYFKLAGFKNVHIAPHKFEGSAEMKWVRDNIWVGGYGIRSEKETYEWMEKKFGLKIIKVQEKNEKLYHLDCSFFPLTKQAALVAKDQFTEEEIKELEQYVEIVDVPGEFAELGITNNVRLHNQILNASDLSDMSPDDGDDYYFERDKVQFLEDILSQYALEPCFINMSEGFKSGALLSCYVMELNRFSYNVDLI